MKLMIIEDNKELLASLTASLEDSAFIVDTAEDGETGMLQAIKNNYDLIILDIGLPRKCGDVICRELRAMGKQMPIIILSVESEIETKATLLLIGADDYVIKPFSFLELYARITACMRRPQETTRGIREISKEIFRVGSLTLNPHARTLTVGREEIHLAPKEFFILEYLLRHRGMVVSRDELFKYIWGEHTDMFSNTIETHMANLRRKLKLKSRRTVIHTIPSGGYKIS